MDGNDPSSIYSWSIAHILEHEFFYFGYLGCAGSKGTKSGFVFLGHLGIRANTEKKGLGRL